ncbi:MAG: tRNA synthetases class II-domain-containing protein [Olpidium bornovanus]|uniref:tRNA synthetases class II-domain-containing protein n=1 Tax=Olpidium bornovanus TaxID=278681 RepID=A0A8H8A1D3_9FUNG|nr:MAG: tRNA synthetases class II-domain-containing protein [Olpidium bornovanus]
MTVSHTQVISQHYDLVLNGCEVAGGSVRVHSAEMQERIFRDILKVRRRRSPHFFFPANDFALRRRPRVRVFPARAQMTDDDVARFRHLLSALESGCPPHAGFDRFMAVLCRLPSIRDVIAFPKTQSGADILVNSPTAIPEEVLREYHLQVVESESAE